jgi:hypothetical protein
MRSEVLKNLWRLLLVSHVAGSAACGSTPANGNDEPKYGDAGTDGEAKDVRTGTDGDGTGPPAAQASLSLHVQEYDSMDPAHTMDRCPPSRHWVNVPFQRERGPTTQTQQTSNVDAPFKAVNNQGGNSISCTVRPNGSAFQVTADATGYAETTEQKLNPSVVHIRISSIGDGDSSAMGTLSLQDAASSVTYSSDQCTFSTQGGALGVADGRIWAAVKCENLADLASPGSVCQVDAGVFVFENCTF